MVLSDDVIDTVFRGMVVPDDMTKLYCPKVGYFPTSIMRGGFGRKGP